MMACPLDATMRFSVANHEKELRKELRSHAKGGYLGLLAGKGQPINEQSDRD
jgi:hypothetical protein